MPPFPLPPPCWETPRGTRWQSAAGRASDTVNGRGGEEQPPRSRGGRGGGRPGPAGVVRGSLPGDAGGALAARQAQEREELAAVQCGEMERLRRALADRLIRGGRGGAPDGSDLSRLRWSVKAKWGQGRFAEAYDAQALVREAEARRAAACETEALGGSEATLPCARMVAAHEEERARLDRRDQRERVGLEARARTAGRPPGVASPFPPSAGAGSPATPPPPGRLEAGLLRSPPPRTAGAGAETPAPATTPSASAHFLRHCRGEGMPSTPVAAATPPGASPSAAGTLLRCMRADAEEARAAGAAATAERASEEWRRDFQFPRHMPHPYLSYDGAGSKAFEELLDKLNEQGGGGRGPARGAPEGAGEDVRVAAVVSRATEGDCAPSLRLGRSFAEELLRTVVPWNDDELVESISGAGATTASQHRAVLEGLNRDDTALFEARPRVPGPEARENARRHAPAQAQRASRTWDPRPDVGFEDLYDRTNIYDTSGSRARERTRQGVPARPPVPKRRQGFQGLAGDDFDRFALSPHHRLEAALAEHPAHLAAPDFERLHSEFRAYAAGWMWGPVRSLDAGRRRAGLVPADMARPARPPPKPVPERTLGHRELERFAAERAAQLRPDAPEAPGLGPPLPPRTRAGLRPR